MYQAWSVPEVLRPLYESSAVLAQKTTMTVRWVFSLFIELWVAGKLDYIDY